MYVVGQFSFLHVGQFVSYKVSIINPIIKTFFLGGGGGVGVERGRGLK